MKTIIIIIAICFLVLIMDNILLRFFMGKFPSKFNKNALFIDVRSPQEFANGTAPNTINIPLNSIEFHLDRLTGHDQLVVFCRSGNRSNTAKLILENNGIQNVINGGSWQNVAKNIVK